MLLTSISAKGELAFYQRNGFVETGLYTDYEGDQYEVLRYLPSRLPGEAHQGMQYADLGGFTQ